MRSGALAVVLATSALLGIGSAAASSERGVAGTWDSFDPLDASYQTLRIRGSHGPWRRVELRDSGASVCGTDESGTPRYGAIARGLGVVEGSELDVSLRVRCIGRARPVVGTVDVVFRHDPITDTLVDSFDPAGEWSRLDPVTDPLTIYRNGSIVSVASEQPTAESVATRGGIVVAVGTRHQVGILRERTSRIVDLDGRALLPGFIDSHAHWIGDRAIPGWATPHEAIDAALRNGFTTISELFVNQERLDELVGLDAAGELPIRVNMFLPVNYHDDKFGLWFDDYSPGQEFSSHLRVAGVKAFVDRANPNLMFLSEEYADQPGYFGHVSWTQEELDAIVAELHDDGWQLAIHTTGDAAHDMVLDAFDAALAGASNDAHRHRIEHVAIVRDDQIDRIRDLGLIASFQLTWFHSDWLGDEFWGPYDDVLGPDRLAWIGRWRDLLDGGVTAIGGTDTPWTPASTPKALHEAVTRIGETGAAPAPWMLDQRISAEEAVRLITADAAYGNFAEGVTGTIEPGKYADLVVLSANPIDVPADHLPEIEVLRTIVGGQPVYCAPALPAGCE